MRDRSKFSRLAKSAAQIAGRPKAFGTAVTLIVVWAITGPLFGFSDTWQLVVNTGTTIVTFLMVFLIQNTQNRDTEAMQIKLDELIRATANANNELLNLEELDQSKLDAYRQKYLALAAEARDSAVKGGRPDTTRET
jgi:low affinity Fe/Cu permease